jgi:AraC-like DNA-binding protein
VTAPVDVSHPVTAFSELAELLARSMDVSASEDGSGRQALCDLANRCQVLVGHAQLEGTAAVLSDLALVIETAPIPEWPHSQYLLQTIWLKTLSFVLLTLGRGGTLPFDSNVVGVAARCMLACERVHSSAQPRSGRAWPQIVVEAVKCMSRGLGDPTMNLKRVAAEVGVSPWYLDRQLRRSIGTSFVPVLRAIKVAESVKLLQSTRMSVKEVAAATGYNYVTTFDRDFKRVHGVPPSEWRRRTGV